MGNGRYPGRPSPVLPTSSPQSLFSATLPSPGPAAAEPPSPAPASEEITRRGRNFCGGASFGLLNKEGKKQGSGFS